MGSIEVPSQLEGNFQFEDVTGDQYGLGVRYRIKRNMTTPTPQSCRALLNGDVRMWL